MEAARRATIEDVPRITELARQAIDELRTQRGGRLWASREARAEPLDASLVAALADDFHVVSVGTIDDAIVGYAVARMEHLRSRDRLAVIDDLYVEPDARGVGVGEALMDLVLAWAVERDASGIDAFTLPGNRATKNFFEAHGLTARAILVHRDLRPEPAVGRSRDPDRVDGVVQLLAPAEHLVPERDGRGHLRGGEDAPEVLGARVAEAVARGVGPHHPGHALRSIPRSPWKVAASLATGRPRNGRRRGTWAFGPHLASS
jgi:ribosomal protein S18 acetylase RimI-like enzyme